MVAGGGENAVYVLLIAGTVVAVPFLALLAFAVGLRVREWRQKQ
jgi:hypothetical protein